MFIESRPVTGFVETAGWALPLVPQEPVPRAPLRRSPLLTSNSSTPSLVGMEQTIPPTLKQPPLTMNDAVKSSLNGYEQTIPPFKDFIKRTPPLEDNKPLPPTPLGTGGSSLSDTTNFPSRELSNPAARRTSSVYSRTVSQWSADSPTWSASDLADNPIPVLPLEYLQPIAYSASTPQLKETKPKEPLLQPRTYQPLLTTPSPTISRCTSIATSPTQTFTNKDLRISVLLPTAVDVAQIPRTHLRTVSLEKAKASSSAPGAEHLLPEEQRARSKGTVIPRARSLEPIVKPPGPITRDTIAMFGRSVDLPPDAPGLPSMTLIDAEGRDRVVGAPRPSVAPSPTFAFPVEPALRHLHTIDGFPVGKDTPKMMVPWAAQDQHDAPMYTPEREQSLSERGRAIQRGSRNSSHDHYQYNGRRRQSSSSAYAEIDAQRFEHDYHSMLTKQHRQASASPTTRSITSDADVGTHMKMVPQPLFNGRLSVIAMAQGKRSRNGSGNKSVSPFDFHHRQQSDSSLSIRSRTSRSGYDYFPSPPRPSRPPRLSTEATNHRRRSSMGTIPISPPFQYSLSPTATVMSPIPRPRNIPPHRRNSDDNRMSAYWHIPTKGDGSELLFHRSKEKKPSAISSSSQNPGLPLLGTDSIVQRLQTPEATLEKSPNDQEPRPVQHQQQQQHHHHHHQRYQSNHSRPISTPSSMPSPVSKGKMTLHENGRVENTEKELTAKQALFSRLTKSAVRYAEKLTRPAGYESQSQTAKMEGEEQRERGRSTTLANLYMFTNPNPNLNNIARKESPHLLHPTYYSSSPNPKQRPSHFSKNSLGWSNAAKTAFDEQQEHLLLQQYQNQTPYQQQQQQHNQDQRNENIDGKVLHHDQTYPRPMHQYQPPEPRPPYPRKQQPSCSTRYAHITTPARPLDGRSGSGNDGSGTYGLADKEEDEGFSSGNKGNGESGSGAASGNGNSSTRRASLFSSFWSNGRREAEAERRRGEIKKSIRVIGVANGFEDWGSRDVGG